MSFMPRSDIIIYMNIFAHKGVVHDSAGESIAHILSDTALIAGVLVAAAAVITIIALRSGRLDKIKASIKDKEANRND